MAGAVKAVMHTLASLAVAVLGGLSFLALGLPLPWLLGSLTATLLVTQLGWTLRVPAVMRHLAMVILGLYAGTAFDQALLSSLGEWPVTMGSMLVLVVLSTWLTSYYLHHRAGYGWSTALFSGVPGAQSVVLLNCARVGADERKVLLTQISRIMVVIYGVPLLLISVLPEVNTQSLGSANPLAPDAWTVPTWTEALSLALAGLSGFAVARLIRLPQPLLLGSLFGVVVAQLSGAPIATVPEPSLMLVQLFLGASMGVKFNGIRLRWALGILGHGLVAMVLTLSMALVFTAVLTLVTDIDPAALFLAFAPGGLPEIVLLAVALDIDPAFVVFHHLLRFIAIALILPWLVIRLTRD